MRTNSFRDVSMNHFAMTKAQVSLLTSIAHCLIIYFVIPYLHTIVRSDNVHMRIASDYNKTFLPTTVTRDLASNQRSISYTRQGSFVRDNFLLYSYCM